MNDPLYDRHQFEFTRNSRLSRWHFVDKKMKPEVVAWIIVTGLFAGLVSLFVGALLAG